MRLSGLLTVLLLAFAGCADNAVDDDPLPAQPMHRHDLDGRVLTPAFNAIQGVRVWIGQSGLCTTDGVCTADYTIVEATTGADGGFRLPGIWPGNTTVHFEHADYVARNVSVAVPAAATNITLVPIDRIVPYQLPMGPYLGYIECGADHLIFSGSCDEFVGEFAPPLQGTFNDQREFTFEVGNDWQTIVLDLSFNDIPATLAGLRLAAYAPDDSAAALDYERYHQAWAGEPFTLRIEPGVDYGDTLPAPENATSIRLEVFPLGHAYREGCTPPEVYDECFTGVGASGQIDFEIIATVFYHEAAPPGWSKLAA